MNQKYAVPYRVNVPTGDVELTGGRFLDAFMANIDFLKGFDTDRMLYWYRVHKGKPAPGAPYAQGAGHFENNLKGQTAGAFLMGAGTGLLWNEDAKLRQMMRCLLHEMRECRSDNGLAVPVSKREFRTREYPNYTRAWITFGLLDAGYAGEKDAFRLARDMGDYFHESEVLPYVKDMNLGFQGILPQTRLYDSPVGVIEDISVGIDAYEERWWLEQLIGKDHRAIYDHPGNHPHGTLLTALEAYADLYRVTGDSIYDQAVKSALAMYEDQWQHVGGGIVMCEYDTYKPGCDWLSRKHNYNELCCTVFWILLNQRMMLWDPDQAHYADEIEQSIYNVLLAAQKGSEGFHYINYLEGTKDQRWTDRCTCCAGLGTRLVGLLPQFLYSYSNQTVYVNLYASSKAHIPLQQGHVHLVCETGLPDHGHVKIIVEKADAPFELKLRTPQWADPNGQSYFIEHTNVKTGDVFEWTFPMQFQVVRYRGEEQVPGKERFAVKYGPLLYAVTGAPSPVHVRWNPQEPQEWLTQSLSDRPGFSIKGDVAHEYRAYVDIDDEPFSVYPLFDVGKKERT